MVASQRALTFDTVELSIDGFAISERASPKHQLPKALFPELAFTQKLSTRCKRHIANASLACGDGLSSRLVADLSHCPCCAAKPRRAYDRKVYDESDISAI
jgi:hypothetical protein